MLENKVDEIHESDITRGSSQIRDTDDAKRYPIQIHNSGKHKTIKILAKFKNNARKLLTKNIEMKLHQSDLLALKSIVLLNRIDINAKNSFGSPIVGLNQSGRKRKCSTSSTESTPSKRSLNTFESNNSIDKIIKQKRKSSLKYSTPVKSLKTKRLRSQRLSKSYQRNLKEQFGNNFFKCHVRVRKITNWPNLTVNELQEQLEIEDPRKKANGLNKSVSFLETVEVFGDSESDHSRTPSLVDESENNDNENKKIVEQHVVKKTISPLKSDTDQSDYRDVLRKSDEKLIRNVEFIDEEDSENGDQTNRNDPEINEDEMKKGVQSHDNEDEVTNTVKDKMTNIKEDIANVDEEMSWNDENVTDTNKILENDKENTYCDLDENQEINLIKYNETNTNEDKDDEHSQDNIKDDVAKDQEHEDVELHKNEQDVVRDYTGDDSNKSDLFEEVEKTVQLNLSQNKAEVLFDQLKSATSEPEQFKEMDFLSAEESNDFIIDFEADKNKNESTTKKLNTSSDKNADNSSISDNLSLISDDNVEENFEEIDVNGIASTELYESSKDDDKDKSVNASTPSKKFTFNNFLSSLKTKILPSSSQALVEHNSADYISDLPLTVSGNDEATLLNNILMVQEETND